MNDMMAGSQLRMKLVRKKQAVNLKSDGPSTSLLLGLGLAGVAVAFALLKKHRF